MRVVGNLFLAYGVFNIFPWPPMHQRDVLAAGGGTLSDTLHIAWSVVAVLFMMTAIGFGAAAYGRRFRLYSIATMVMLLALGGLTGLDAPRMQGNLPTPWIGVWERISIGVFLLWVVVLAVTLLRALSRRHGGEAHSRRAGQGASKPVDGWVAPGFEAVRAEFERNFAERGEIGAAVAAYWRGEKVVDLWGGRRAPDGDAPWNEDTMVVAMSCTKGLAALTLAVANARGLARLRRAGRALLARVRAERQSRGHRAPAPRARGRPGPARRAADDRQDARSR